MKPLVNAVKTSLKALAIGSLMVASSAADKIAIVGGTIHSMGPAGVIDDATLLINDGKIEAIIEGNSAPSGYTKIDASGKIVTPGFIAAYSSLGLVEVGMSAGIVDARVEPSDVSTVGAALDTQYAINPDSTLLPITRIEGFTSAATGLGGTEQLFQGQGSIISLDKDLDLLQKPAAFVRLDASGSGANDVGESRAAFWITLNQVIDEVIFAKNYQLDPSKAWHGMASRADINALKPVIDGNTPLLVTADRASDILQVVELKKRHPQMNIVLVRATDAWRVAKQLADANIPVILDPEYNLPGSFEQLGASLENAARLHEAGVMLAIGMDTHNARLATQHAGNAVANGLPHAAGLAALSINVAKIYGVDGQLGSLEPGKQADVVIWSGDPLQVTEAPIQVFVKGEALPMESRQTKLRDRYMALQADKPFGYIR